MTHPDDDYDQEFADLLTPDMDDDTPEHDQEEDDDDDLDDPGYDAEVEVIESRVSTANKSGKTVATKRKTYDWPVIRSYYVEGYEDEEGSTIYPRTYKDVAKHFDMTETRVREVAGKERWRDLRAINQAKEEQARKQLRRTELSRRAVGFDAKALQTAELGMNLILSRLAEVAKEAPLRQRIQEQARADLEAGFPTVKEDFYSAIRHHEMMNLSAALDRFQDIGRKALGEDVQRHEINGVIDGTIEHTVSIRDEMERDDGEKLHRFLRAAIESGLLDDERLYEPEVVDANIVDPDGQEQLSIEG